MLEKITLDSADPLGTEETPEKDLPLRNDIRLLGRILGETLRSQAGDAMFEIVERVRRSSIRFHRDADEIARQELESILNRLAPDETTRVIRSFTYFSHLGNLAEDQHHIRRTRAHAMRACAPPRYRRPRCGRSLIGHWFAPCSPPIRPRCG